MSKNEEKYTEDNLGDIISFSNKSGTYRDERIVHVFFREAGGFLGGHDVFHAWEMKDAVLTAGGYGA
jgi:hypothetical protein